MWLSSIRLHWAALALLAGCGSDVPGRTPPANLPAPAPVHSAVLTISAQGGTPVKLRQGFLHGLSKGRTSDTTDQLVDTLKPGAWRVSNLFGTHDYVEQRQLRHRFGTKIAFNLQDLFSAKWGNPIVVGPDCVANTPRHCFASFAELRSEWSAFVSQFMLAVQARGGAGIDHFDVFSEPGSTFKGLDRDQIFDLLKVAHDGIRKHRPDAVIVAPSIERFDGPGLDAMLAFAAANNVRIDALSWHELEGNPNDVPGHIAEARRIIDRRFPAKPGLAPRQFHINEYGPPQNHLIPGWTVGWLAAFETGGIDIANRACWQVLGGWTDCANGLDGLLLEDNATPQPLFHLHRAWAGIPPLRLRVDGQVPGLAAIAGRDSTGITLLVGRYSCGRSGKWCQGAPRPVRDEPVQPLDVRLEIGGLGPERAASVAMECYPNLAVAAALPAPQTLPGKVVPVGAGKAVIDLPGFPDGGACRIRID